MRFLAFILVSFVSQGVFGQNYTISTFAGSSPQVGIQGTSASLGGPTGVAVDSAGNVFFSVQTAVLRLDAQTGILTTVAGNGTNGFSGDNGPATSAQLYGARGVAVDAAGNVYIADSSNNRIRKVSNGVITTVAGGGDAGLGDRGPAIKAQLNVPYDVAVDSQGNLFIADTYNSRIRKVSNGEITTVAGNGTFGFSDNLPATQAALNYPFSVAVDSAGNLYIADYSNLRIRMVSNGTMTTLAGNGSVGFSGDNGPATSAELDGANGVAVDSAGNVYIADTFSNRIRKVSNGVITTIAGDGFPGSVDSGSANRAEFDYPLGIASDPDGNLYVADYADSRIREISGGEVTTVAGNAELGFSGDNGVAANVQFFEPYGVTVDPSGNVFIADFGNARIRQVSSGAATTAAGSALYGFFGDNGSAIRAELNEPIATAVDSQGNLYIADAENNRIRVVSNGLITTFAGSGSYGVGGFGGDNGPATSAQLNYPRGVAVDSAGNVYIADAGNERVRKVSNGIITTVAGNGMYGYGGDGGAATSATLAYPAAVAVDSAGSLYIADNGNSCIRKVSNGTITTVAGNPALFFGFAGDNGPATSAGLSFPNGIAVDSAGNLFIADTGNQRVREVSNGIITTIAGNGGNGFSGDGGPGTVAQLNTPGGVAVDLAGNVYIADSNNNRIRILTPAPPAPPPSITSVLNAFSNSPTVAPNTWVSIKGSGLAPSGDSRIWTTADFGFDQMPTSLDAVSVTMNGENAYVYYISPSQMNILTPPDLALGNAQVQVFANGQTSAAFTVQVQAYSPAFFVFNGGPYVIATHLNGSIIGPATLYPGLSTPAQPGESVVLYANGFGPTFPGVVKGSELQSGSLKGLPAVQIGGVSAVVQFAGLISPGLYQFNVVVPASAASGDNMLTAQYNGQSTQMGLLLTVQSIKP